MSVCKFAKGNHPVRASWAQTGVELSREARVRLHWMEIYRRCRNVARTCRRFGISHQTFYRWQRRYDLRLARGSRLVLVADVSKLGLRPGLQQGLSAQLEQSPFLNLCQMTAWRRRSPLMAQPKDARLTGKLAREV